MRLSPAFSIGAGLSEVTVGVCVSSQVSVCVSSQVGVCVSSQVGVCTSAQVGVCVSVRVSVSSTQLYKILPCLATFISAPANTNRPPSKPNHWVTSIRFFFFNPIRPLSDAKICFIAD